MYLETGFRLLPSPVQLNCSCFKKGQRPSIAGERIWLVCALNPGSSLDLPFLPWPISQALCFGTSPKELLLPGMQTPS